MQPLKRGSTDDDLVPSNSPFGLHPANIRELRAATDHLCPSPLIGEAQGVSDYGKQHGIPECVLELYRRTRGLELTSWEQEAIRASLNSRDGVLRQILDRKAERCNSTDPRMTYIRVDCFGKRIQSPCLLEIWPGGHFSPIHEHAGSIGLIRSMFGRVEMMVYRELSQNPQAVALLSLSPGLVSWLSPEFYQVHKVSCPMHSCDFAATFHIYNDCQRDTFRYQDEREPDRLSEFLTESDMTWHDLRRVLSKEVPYYANDAKSH